MAGKARVHELAKELGVTSKEVLARLSEQGEFVKSASSTVEAPVARRLRESFGGGKPAPEKAAGNGAGSAKPAVKDAAPAPAKPAAPKPAAPAPTPPEPPAPPAPAPEPPQQAGSTDAPGRSRADPRSTSGGPEAGGTHAARRQQSLLLSATGGPADTASAGATPGCSAPSARWCVARQHAAASGRCRCRWARSPATSRWPAASRWWSPTRWSRWPAGRSGRWPSRRWWRR